MGTWVNVPLYHNNVSVALMLVSSQQSEEKVFPATCLLYWIVPKCPNPRPMNFKGASLSTLIQPNFPTKFFSAVFQIIYSRGNFFKLDHDIKIAFSSTQVFTQHRVGA